MLLTVSFPIIVGETPTGKYLRRLLPVSVVLLLGAILGGLVPRLRWLLPPSASGYVLLLVAAGIAGRKSQFVLDGKVEFYENELRVRGQSWPLAELRRVEARFQYARGEGAGANGMGDDGNLLLVYGRQPGPPLQLTVLVTSQAQRQALYRLLMRWRQRGQDVLAYIL